MVASQRIAVGREGEELAAAHMKASGMIVLDRNWRSSSGEVDLIARDREEIVFAEVKTRSGHGSGHPFEAVTPAKVSRLRKLAGEWILRSGLRVRQLRIDVIGITVSREPGEEPVIEHLRDVG